MHDNIKNKLEQALKDHEESSKILHSKWGFIFGIIGLLIGVTMVIALQGAGSSSQRIKPIPGKGKITSPQEGDTTGRIIEVTGYTKDIPIDYQYIWLVVDKPQIGLCWPKGHKIPPNTHFRTSIYEGGPTGKFILSLYALNQSRHDEIMRWIDDNKFGGIPMLPQHHLLDKKICYKVSSPEITIDSR